MLVDLVPSTAPGMPAQEPEKSLRQQPGLAVNIDAATAVAEADLTHPWALLHGYNFGDDIDEIEERRSGAPRQEECI
ncbi:MAG TPA: hypothetical protein VGY58_23760 [Gemmataceae bacterium]|jgi:hypothetical protein|nr:hypothetical protein [Gemmataceae bacterium]